MNEAGINEAEMNGCTEKRRSLVEFCDICYTFIVVVKFPGIKDILPPFSMSGYSQGENHVKYN